MNSKPGKLIRDHVPQLILALNLTPNIRTVTDPAEFRDRLGDKLREEAAEVADALNASSDDTTAVVGELADVTEVVHAILAVIGIEHASVEKARLANSIPQYPDRLGQTLREQARKADKVLNAPAGVFDTAAVVGKLADVMRVLDAIAAEVGVERDLIETARIVKLGERGGFSQGIIWFDNAA